ncbi:MAG: hypothetical protein DLM59_10835 [Pseudonocardiales bacterium]|nr:MAG: hypothetical protein DLM59_10835 [Pseudonocardiales bacterium]
MATLLLSLVIVQLTTLAPAHAVLSAIGPIDPSTGFPAWYEDATGLRLRPCITSTTNCFTGATVPNASLPPSVSTGNLPTESFYYAANANMPTAGGGNAFLQVSLSGGFVGHVDCGTVSACPEPGKQAVFGRLRLRIDNLVPGQLYTVAYPWGSTRLRATASGLRSIDYTVDAGCAASPGAPAGCNPALALGGPASPFLGWDPAVAPAAPAGFLGSWPVRHAITGSRIVDADNQPGNYFRVTGPDVGGAGVDTISTNLFQINGQVERPALADSVAPSAPVNLVATATGTGTVRLSWDSSTDAYGGPAYRVFRDGSATPVATVTSPTYVDSGLAAGSAHSYAVDAVDQAGNASSPAVTGATTAATQDVSPPSTPTGLAAVPVAPTRIDLSWGQSADTFGVSGYRVYRDGQPSPLTFVEGATGFSDTNVAPGSTHSYRVSAVDFAANESAGSVPVSGSTAGVPDGTAPEAPTGLAAAATGVNSVLVTWNAAADNVGPTGYRLFRDDVLLATTGSTTLIFDDTGLAAGSSHAYSVQALDGAGNLSGRSSPVTVTTAPAVVSNDVTAPSTPDAVTTVADSPTRVTLFWTVSTDDTAVTGYHVYRAGATTPIARVTSPRYVDNGLTSGASYAYSVSAFDAAGNESARSMQVPATTVLSADTNPPSAPQALTATATDSTTIRLTWAAGTDDVAVGGYRVYRNGDPIPIATPTGLSFVDRQLVPGATYTYVVSAADRAGNESDMSAPGSASPLRTRCKAPVIGTAASGSTTDKIVSAKATWTPAVHSGCIVTSYIVVAVRVSSGARKTGQAGPTATSLVFPGLVSGQQYAFVVQATDGVNTSVSSSRSQPVIAR